MSSRPQRARQEPAGGSSATPGAGPSRPRRQTRTQKQEENEAEKAKQRAHGGAVDQETDDDDGDYWDVVQVLDERHDSYLLQWADVNPATGEIWDPSWEPRSYVSDVLVQEWAEKKAQDPTIIGVEGKKLKELRKARALEAKKRKREEKEATAAAATVNKRSRTGICELHRVSQTTRDEWNDRLSKHLARGSTGTPGLSKSSVAAPRSSVKREDGLSSKADHTNGTFADPVIIIDDDDEVEAIAVQPQRRSASASTSSRGKRTVEVVIGVPSPTTTEHNAAPAGPLVDDEVAADDLMASQQLDGDAVAIDHADVTDEPPVDGTLESLPALDAETPGDAPEADDPQAELVMEVQVEEEIIPDDQADPSAIAGIADTVDETRELGPVPVPTATQFRAALPPALHAAADAADNATQSTTSVGATQLDPIQQFSSPVRETHAAGKGKGKSAPEPSNAPVEAADAHAEPNDGPKIVKRFINGEEVMAIESQSSDEGEGGAGDGETPVMPAPDVTPADDPAPPAIVEEVMQVEIVEESVIEEPVQPAAVAATSPAPAGQEMDAPVAAPAAEQEPSAEAEASATAVQTDTRIPTTTSHEIDVLAALLQSLSEGTFEQPPVETFNLEDYDLTPAGRAIAEALQNGQAETKRWRIRAKKAEKAAKKATEDAQQDLAFIREQYNNASNSAVAAVNKSEELEEKMAILQGQLKFGLKQRETHTAAIKAQHDKEVAQLRAQLQLLLSQSRQTDDRVRAKAVAHDRLKKEVEAKQAHIEFLAGMNNDLNIKINDLSIRNDELLGQVEVFRAREMGVIGPNADADGEGADDIDSGSESEGSYTSSDSDLPPIGAPTFVVTPFPYHPQEPLTASQLMPVSQDLAPYPPSTPAPEDAQVLAEPTRREHHGSAHRSPDTPDLFFADAAAVKEHVMQNVDAAFS